MSPAEVDAARRKSERLARLSSRLAATGDIDDAVDVLDCALDLKHRANRAIEAWAEAPRRPAPIRRTA